MEEFSTSRPPRKFVMEPLRVFPAGDPFWTEIRDVALAHVRERDVVFAHQFFLEYFPQALLYPMLTRRRLAEADLIIFYKGSAGEFSAEFIEELLRDFDPLFANDAFILFAAARHRERMISQGEFNPAHVESLRAIAEEQRKTVRGEAPNERCILEKIRELREDRGLWPPVAELTEDAGIVISGCGRLFNPLYANLRIIRASGCRLPIEIWHLSGEFTPGQIQALQGMADFVEAGKTPFDGFSGQEEVWGFKAWMLSQSRFRKTLMLDVNCFPLRNVEFLFESGERCILWNDGPWGCCHIKLPQLRNFLNLPLQPFEFESGQLFVNKESPGIVDALRLAAALNTLGKPLYVYTYGDKETYAMALDLLGEPFTTAPEPDLHPREGMGYIDTTLIHLWLDETELFYHPLGAKHHWWTYREEWADLNEEAKAAEAVVAQKG